MVSARLLIIFTTGALALACSEEQQKTPTSPQFAPPVPPPSNDCNFSQISPLINDYFSFSSSLKTQASALERDMEADGPQTLTAVQRGFDIMVLIGQASRQATPPAVTGGELTKALIKCMFNAASTEYTSLAGGNGLDAIRFDSSLIKLHAGAYYVKGGDGGETNTPNAVITAADFTGPSPVPLSAVGPGPATETSPGNWTLGNWDPVLAGNTANNNQEGRALIYGYPVTTSPIVFEWATIPPNTQFDPYALVSICDGSTDQTLMVHETGAGALGFVGVNLCNYGQSLTMLENGWGPRALAFRLANWTNRLWGSKEPQAPAYIPDATGSTKTGFRSQFKDESVTGLNISVSVQTQQPGIIIVNTGRFSVTADLKTSAGAAIGGVENILSAINNKGTPTQVLQVISTSETGCPSPAAQSPTTRVPPKLTTTILDQVSSVTWTNLCVNKTGAIVFVDTANEPGRDIAGTGFSPKDNVKNPTK